MSIRDNRIAAESMGIDVTKYKTDGIYRVGGPGRHGGRTVFPQPVQSDGYPKNFGYNMSIMILVFVVLGGIGNIRGSIIAAVVLTCSRSFSGACRTTGC